ncbi:MAG: hypothetical protein CMH39_00580 [Micrococcales bacterium]|nr:hypothetical protein [Micrococcales bacterium]|tara:strand:+ start:50 stop:430 length:381 start_codon:yes stop_codon:yes gene_type:complete
MTKMPISFHEWDMECEKWTLVILNEDNEYETESYDESRHEEGWTSMWVRYSVEEDAIGKYVLREWESDGVDCDGRLSSSGKHFCYLQNLRDRPMHGYDHETTPVFLPKWEELERRQRDYSAEAMGY